MILNTAAVKYRVSIARSCHNLIPQTNPPRPRGESRDFRILKNGGFLSKLLDSGKTFFDISVNTDQIGVAFEADTPEK